MDSFQLKKIMHFKALFAKLKQSYPYSKFKNYSCLVTFVKPNSRSSGNAFGRLSLEREVLGLNLGLVKSDAVLPTARHRCSGKAKRKDLVSRMRLLYN